MDFSKYKNGMTYGLHSIDANRLDKITKSLKASKPNGLSHEQYGKQLDELEIEQKDLLQRRKEMRELYNQEEARLEALFWTDAFEDLGLEDVNEEIKQVLRSKAYENGHSSGYYEVFNYLLDFAEIVQVCLEHK